MSIDPNAADLSCDTNSPNYHENRLKRLSWDNSCYMLASAGRDFEITRRTPGLFTAEQTSKMNTTITSDHGAKLPEICINDGVICITTVIERVCPAA
ncbi:Uncharacterized protein HZ326_27319 [Fusarium oxysporum f. sp. albedinis]|nr:Uncharacterized protein HZ326_27319 [Fusarium oxysporum f. sp. albedinis]